ncbi:hypothetical protein CNEO2_90020 [Clostridium neonatale]|uniref:Uncharacterized protein n=1 Tax=Clostridium neonatale TaxID=137838 RepID=A0AAD1Y9P6_9CLOT|nr:hypothetical protein CNEO2_110071 [Clostridium neonatale]CAI3197060.1 hypothetical protein CNEO2_150070 [Clostridium neonatale]CAI3214357.1 hypothetical protein CNEO2_60080 [Clostridium neonatale]CAI3218084.1 hypothetical protein CNEO2_100072 [Clostridium neonatale]CAI3239698.1 hypothetical protein CNEO2_20066 [Clostridium neonatale]
MNLMGSNNRPLFIYQYIKYVKVQRIFNVLIRTKPYKSRVEKKSTNSTVHFAKLHVIFFFIYIHVKYTLSVKCSVKIKILYTW